MAALLLIGLLAWGRTAELQKQLRQLQGELHGIRTHVSHEISGIRGTVQAIREDSRWWSPGAVQFLEEEEDTALLKISWQVREMREDSTVAFHYRLPGEDNFVEAEVQELGEGFFAAVIAAEAPPGPLWNISIHRTSDSGNRRLQSAVVEEKIIQSLPNGEETSMSYYISLREGDTTRTSEIRTLDLGKLSLNRFGIVHANLHLQDSEIKVTLHEYERGETGHRIESAYLESRRGREETLERWPLQPLPDERGAFSAEVTFSEPYGSLFLVVHYPGQPVVEKELPPI